MPPQDQHEEFTKLQKLEEKEEQLRKKTEEKNLIKNSIEKRVTRSMTKKDAPISSLNQQQNAIFAIGNLIISDSEKLKLWLIVWKIHQYLPLSQEEQCHWNSFAPKERNFLLTGDEIFSPEVIHTPNNLHKLTRNIEKVIRFQPNNPVPIQIPIHNPAEPEDPDNIDWEETAADLDLEENLDLHLSEDSASKPPTPPPIPQKKRGRPPGSKNKPKPPQIPNPDSISQNTRSHPKKDNGPDCYQMPLFCGVSPHPGKCRSNSNSKQPSSGI